MGTFTAPTVDDLTTLAEAIDAGKLKVFVNRVFPLAESQTVIFYDAPSGEVGKLLISIS